MHAVAPDVRYRRVGDELVAVRQDAAEVVVLNETGARVLELIGQNRALDEIVEQMLLEFDTDRQTLERDVAECLEQFAAAGLLEPGSPEEISGKSASTEE